MIKKNIRCTDCGISSSIFIKIKEEPKCPDCDSTKVKILYKPLKLATDIEPANSTGELSQEYIEENKFVLEEMKKEKMIWNS